MDSPQVMIVDDSPHIVTAIKMTVESLGYGVVGAHDGESALSFLRSHPSIQLIFLDIGMPVMDGFQFIKKISRLKIERELKICFISGRGEKESVVQAILLGADDYIVKPIDEPILIAKLHKFLTNVEKKDGGFAKLSVNLQAYMQNASIRPDLYITVLSESHWQCRCSARLRESEIFEIAVPTLDSLTGKKTLYYCRVVHCTKKRFGLYLTQFELVGLPEQNAMSIRSLAIKGNFIGDQEEEQDDSFSKE
ncbi:MAG: response regulator [Bdellovibrionota bacterium]